MPAYSSPLDALRRHWGYDSFRPLQASIIASVLNGNDTLALMPTGGGKSITFQVPGLMLPGLTVVVTPLISLMKDQVDNLRAHDIAAVYLHSGLTAREARLAMQKAELG
ncbi:MAG: DEAD/DEAH box helicase, partial [Muribaculaceae bacterium]|nr:DEAD/DEAH box helicase [Muribaculaceae bacterium]